jgi:hypothetical protein
MTTELPRMADASMVVLHSLKSRLFKNAKCFLIMFCELMNCFKACEFPSVVMDFYLILVLCLMSPLGHLPCLMRSIGRL